MNGKVIKMPRKKKAKNVISGQEFLDSHPEVNGKLREEVMKFTERAHEIIKETDIQANVVISFEFFKE